MAVWSSALFLKQASAAWGTLVGRSLVRVDAAQDIAAAYYAILIFALFGAGQL